MSIELFFRNIKYLFKYNIKHIAKYLNEEVRYQQMITIEKMFANEDYFLNNSIEKIKVLSANDSVDYLLKNPVSFCRFGDGELDMIFDERGNFFQHYHESLKERLRTILQSNNPNIAIGINYFFFNRPEGIYSFTRRFYRITSYDYRQKCTPLLSLSKTYLDSACTAPYHIYLPECLDYKDYFDKFSLLWKDKDIVVICGKCVIKNIQHNIFSNAKSIEYIYGPSMDAFSQYDQILDKALQTVPSKTKFIILGHTATVLAYDLALHGHRAIDIGHLVKDYNSFCNKESITDQNIDDFYRID